MFKLDKRDGKYYRKFSDCEVEITESELKKQVEWFSEIESECNYLMKEYPSMTIGEFNNKVQPYEQIKKLYWELEKKILISIDKKEISIENAILTLKHLKLEFNLPKNSLSKTSENDDYNIGFIQNIIDKLELCKSMQFQETDDKSITHIKPTFSSESIPTILHLLKDFFSAEHGILLKQILETGNMPIPKLLFHGSGKTLLDFFKQLLTGQFLVVAVQKDLEIWISGGFEYLHQRKRKKILPKYASKIISGNERAAKGNRLIDVVSKNGKFEIFQCRISSRQQN